MAITDSTGAVTDTFQYDTYGKQTARTGTSEVIFGYNGRDGVITDSNSLLYMRARYYSPELRRFINADIIAGEISNAITLNRYAYANGNPVSNVDPFGLTSRGVADTDIFINIPQTSDRVLAANMLATTLDQILNFRNVFAASSKLSLEIPIDKNTTVSYSTAVKRGSGNLEISSVISDQLDLLASMSFSASDLTLSVSSDHSIEVEYSCKVDRHTAIIVSLSGVVNVSLSASYKVITTDAYNNSISTSVGLTYNNSQKPNQVTVPVPEEELSTESNWDWLEKVGLGLIAVGATALAGVALVETAATGGMGIWNDAPALSGAAKAWADFIASFSSSAPALVPG